MKDSNGVEHTIDLVRARSGVGNGVYLDDKKRNGILLVFSLRL